MTNIFVFILTLAGAQSLGEKAYDLATNPEKRQELRKKATHTAATIYVEFTLAAHDFKQFVIEKYADKAAPKKAADGAKQDKKQE